MENSRTRRYSTRRKGAVLIMTLMALCLVFMMVHVLMQTTGISLLSMATFYEREQALQAAQSGIDYAVTQLQTNQNWIGNCNIINPSGEDEKSIWHCGGSNQALYVAESSGNVVGIIKAKSGYISVFRLKFSFEDTSEDTLKNAKLNNFGDAGSSTSKTELPIAFPFVSVNNLTGATNYYVQRANSNGKGIDHNAKKVDSALDSTQDYVCGIPAQAVCLIAEGVAGKALRDVKTPKEANEIINSSNRIVRRYVEAWYTGVPPIITTDAAFAKNDVKFTIKNKLFVSSVRDDSDGDLPNPGNLRSQNAEISVLNGKLNTFSLEDNRGRLMSASGQKGDIANDGDKYTYTVTSDGKQVKKEFTFTDPEYHKSQSQVASLEWNDVSKAENTSANKLQPGFYQWHKAADSTDTETYYELRYYEDGCVYDSAGSPQPRSNATYKLVTEDVNASGTTAQVGGTPVGLVAMAPSGKISFHRDQDNHIDEPTLQVNGKLYCDGDIIISGVADEMAGRVPNLAMGSFTKPSDEAEGDEGRTEAAEEGLITVLGKVYLDSSVNGTGSLIAQDDVTMLGESLLQAGESGIGIYSGGSVNLGTVDTVVSQTPSGESVSNGFSNAKEAIEATVSANETNGDSFKVGSSAWDYIWKDMDYSTKFDNSRKHLPNNWCFVQYSTTSSGLNTNKTTHDCKYTKLSDDDAKLIQDYYKEKFGVYIKVRFMGFERVGNSAYERMIGYVYTDKNGNLLTQGNKRCYDVWKNGGFSAKEAGMDGSYNWGSRIVTTHKIPENARVKDVDIPEGLEADVSKLIQNFGSVCYGDQVIKGVIYARNNFNANLGNQYNLVVTGAIKAENGSINVTCKNARLNYEANNVNKLLPPRVWLTRYLWQCW